MRDLRSALSWMILRDHGCGDVAKLMSRTDRGVTDTLASLYYPEAFADQKVPALRQQSVQAVVAFQVGWQGLVDVRFGADGFKSLRDTWADTTTAHGRLMLTVLGGLAEFERELIRTRTGAGRERAKARG